MSLESELRLFLELCFLLCSLSQLVTPPSLSSYVLQQWFPAYESLMPDDLRWSCGGVALGSFCKYRRSFTHLTAAHLLPRDLVQGPQLFLLFFLHIQPSPPDFTFSVLNLFLPFHFYYHLPTILTLIPVCGFSNTPSSARTSAVCPII